MARSYAICRISGVIELAHSVPEGCIALAEGEREALRRVISATAQISPDGLTVPGLTQAENEQQQRAAIAAYIHTLTPRNGAHFTALGA
ncbi:host nuclease inhibitor protein [Pseudomonas sp. GV071]|uniref:host nuclease inhibitor protein n=1 Tax=Pseudomonas sp. GV071 TaxID=2135754 RepID=UPI000D3A9146|nr:host nuclease inhibitor protein [Pseudomonas sp. GV071]PTQ68151.1 hypothetical protein C8K61_11267 [Pseudomonas sp. GV071]